jgi:ribose transport system substrate-binding protein
LRGGITVIGAWRRLDTVQAAPASLGGLKMKRSSFLKSAALAGAGAAATGSGLTSFAPMAEALAASSGRTISSLKFSCIVKTVASPYWSIVLTAAKKAAKDLGLTGMQFTGGPSEADIASEVNLIENAIAQKPDFLVIAPTDKTGLNAAINQAYKAGIKVILIDSDAPAAPRNAFLSTDNYHAGQLCADALAAAIKAKTGAASGQVGYITFQSNVGSLSLRDNGFLAGLKTYPGLKLVAHKDAGGDPSYVKEAGVAGNTLTAFPSLVGMFGDNLQCVEGAAQAFKEKGVNMKKLSLVGFDSDSTLVSELKAGRVDGLLLQDPYMMGYGGVLYGMLAALGVKVPLFVDTGATVATPALSSSALIQGLLDPTGKPGRGLGL